MSISIIITIIIIIIFDFSNTITTININQPTMSSSTSINIHTYPASPRLPEPSPPALSTQVPWSTQLKAAEPDWHLGAASVLPGTTGA